MNKINEKAQYTVTIRKLVFGGYGIATHPEAGTVFVNFVLPDETVLVHIVGKTGGVPLAVVDEVLSRSQFRVAPECPHFGVCGGCNWQHILYKSQVEQKLLIFLDCLKRIGKLELPEGVAVEVFESSPWNYRIRAQFKLNLRDAKAGFFRENSHEVVSFARCPLLVEPLNEFYRRLSLQTGDISQDHDSVQSLCGDGGRIASYPVLKNKSESETVITVAGCTFAIAGGGFFQSNGPLLDALGTWARPRVNGEFCLDLYGGAGFFSVLLGKNFSRGTLVESHAGSAAAAVKNFAANGLATWNVEAAPVERFLVSAKIPTPDLVIVDPPRLGLSVQCRQLLGKMKPHKILYVACDPSTQARDLGYFVKECGYKISAAALFDLYPQTHHLETGVILEI